MDDVWLQAVASKDSLFANEWPLSAWVANLGTLGVLWAATGGALRTAAPAPKNAALVWGATALVALFLITLPAVAAHVAFPVQLQISRVFWLVDFVATACLVGARRRLAVAGAARAGRRWPCAWPPSQPAAAPTSCSSSIPSAPLFETRLPPSPWHEAMQWLATQPIDAHVLADSGHAWRYGTSVRVSAGRDVFLEETKDAAIAIYSRDVAVRVVERIGALGNLATRADGRRAAARRTLRPHARRHRRPPRSAARVREQRRFASTPWPRRVQARRHRSAARR